MAASVIEMLLLMCIYDIFVRNLYSCRRYVLITCFF